MNPQRKHIDNFCRMLGSDCNSVYVVHHTIIFFTYLSVASCVFGIFFPADANFGALFKKCYIQFLGIHFMLFRIDVWISNQFFAIDILYLKIFKQRKQHFCLIIKYDCIIYPSDCCKHIKVWEIFFFLLFNVILYFGSIIILLLNLYVIKI